MVKVNWSQISAISFHEINQLLNKHTVCVVVLLLCEHLYSEITNFRNKNADQHLSSSMDFWFRWRSLQVNVFLIKQQLRLYYFTVVINCFIVALIEYNCLRWAPVGPIRSRGMQLFLPTRVVCDDRPRLFDGQTGLMRKGLSPSLALDRLSISTADGLQASEMPLDGILQY